MNGIIKKKLNLLVHLARVDGHFHKSERDMILNLVGNSKEIDQMSSTADPLADIDTLRDKEEIFYLALKLVQADGVITEEELAFCRRLAGKLGFRETAADRFVRSPLPSMAEFVEDLSTWRAPE